MFSLIYGEFRGGRMGGGGYGSPNHPPHGGSRGGGGGRSGYTGSNGHCCFKLSLKNRISRFEATSEYLLSEAGSSPTYR